MRMIATSSTCPDSFCRFRNSFGYCSVTECIYHPPEDRFKSVELPAQECKLCKCDLKDGDYLYQRGSQDHAMVFEEIIVHYCPVCGRKL